MPLLDILQRYALISHLLLACAIGHTSTVASGFYDFVTTFLANKTCVAIFYNYAFMLFIFGCKVPVLIFMGQLSQLEAETLVESARNYLMDAILFLVLSKPRLNGKEVIMGELVKVLTFLVALKCFHIMLYTRLSHMFQVDMPGFFKLFRISSLIYVLSILNCCLLNFFWKGLNRRNTFTIWILFEIFGMLSSLLFCVLKLVVNIFDMYSDSGLVNKVTLLFYVELAQDIVSLLSFLVFMVVFFLNNPVNVPVYMLIDIIHVAKNLSVRLKMLLHYKRLSKILTTRFPAATKDEVEREINCIICRDFLDETCRRIDCGHIFHLNCLKSWLFQHSSCPSCRSPIDNTDTGSYFSFHAYLVKFERKCISFAKKCFNVFVRDREPRVCKLAVEKNMKEIKNEIMQGYSIMCRVCIDYINSGEMDPESVHSDILWIRNNLRGIMNSLTATSESYARLLQDSQQSTLLNSLESRMAALQDENLAPLLSTINLILRDVRRNSRSERMNRTAPNDRQNVEPEQEMEASLEETVVATVEQSVAPSGDIASESKNDNADEKAPDATVREKKAHSMNLWLPKWLFSDSLFYEDKQSEQASGENEDGNLDNPVDSTSEFPNGESSTTVTKDDDEHLEESTNDDNPGSKESEPECIGPIGNPDCFSEDIKLIDKYTLRLNALVSHLLPCTGCFGRRFTEREIVEEMREIYQSMSVVWLIAVASLLQVTSKGVKGVVMRHLERGTQEIEDFMEEEERTLDSEELLELLCGEDSKALLKNLHEEFQTRSIFYIKLITSLKKSQLSQRFDLSQALLLSMALSDKVQAHLFDRIQTHF